MKKIVFIVIFLSGCSTNQIDFEELHDSRFDVGCAVVNGNYNGSYLKGSVNACKLVCSKDLPDNYYYEYKNNFCLVRVGIK